jgi:hypothetical protein
MATVTLELALRDTPEVRIAANATSGISARETEIPQQSLARETTMTADRMMAITEVAQTLVDQFAIRKMSTDRTTVAMNAAEQQPGNE